jgi:DNA-binding MarR family transcriptional regulator
MTDQKLITEIIQLHWAVLNFLQTSTRPDLMELDMSMAQIKALFAISIRGTATINEIAEFLGVSQPTASQVVDKVVQGGFAERSEGEQDRRVKQVRLTDKGSDLVSRLYRGSEAPYRETLSQMKTADLQSLRKGLQALLAAANNRQNKE